MMHTGIWVCESNSNRTVIPTSSRPFHRLDWKVGVEASMHSITPLYDRLDIILVYGCSGMVILLLVTAVDFARSSWFLIHQRGNSTKRN